MLDRVKVGDVQGEGDQAAGGRATAGSHRDAVFLGEADKVGDNEKITGKAHLFDGLEFVFQALAIDRFVQVRLFLAHHCHAALIPLAHLFVEQLIGRFF